MFVAKVFSRVVKSSLPIIVLVCLGLGNIKLTKVHPDVLLNSDIFLSDSFFLTKIKSEVVKVEKEVASFYLLEINIQKLI